MKNIRMLTLCVGLLFILLAVLATGEDAAGAFQLRGEESSDRDEVEIKIEEEKVVVEWGNRPTSGYSVDILDDLHFVEGILYVNYVLEPPQPGEVVLPIVTYPDDSKQLPKKEEEIDQIRGGEISYQIEDEEIVLKWKDRPSSGYYIDIVSLKVQAGTLVVNYTLDYPHPDEERIPLEETVMDAEELPVEEERIENVLLNEQPVYLPVE